MNTETALISVNDSISIRSLNYADFPALVQVLKENYVYLRKWLGWTGATIFEKYAQPTAQLKADGNNYFLIMHQQDIAGMIVLEEDLSKSSTSLGYWLAERFQNRGIMKAAVKTMLQYSKDELKLKKLKINCSALNNKSRAIAENFKFNLVAVEIGSLKLNGEFQDLLIYEKELS